MYAKAEANSTYPVIFIARQTFDGTVSFSIPLQPEGYVHFMYDVLYEQKKSEILYCGKIFKGENFFRFVGLHM